MSQKICPKCGTVIYDGDFCFECGTKLDVEAKGFFNKVDAKISFSTLVFSCILVGIFLFIGSIFWSVFASNGTFGFTTHVLLTVILAVFIGGVFLGYCNCFDSSYIVPNFLAFFGTIAAAILCGIGGIFTILIGFSSAWSSVFSSSSSSVMSNVSSLGNGGTNVVSSIVTNFIVDIFILVLLIPCAAYLGIYLGYLIKTNL